MILQMISSFVKKGKILFLKILSTKKVAKIITVYIEFCVKNVSIVND
jgi:hypothetical protein